MVKITKLFSTILVYSIQQGHIISFKENFQMCLSISFHNYKIVFKVRIVLFFKLNQLIVPIGKKPAPRRPRIQFENIICKLSFARCIIHMPSKCECVTVLKLFLKSIPSYKYIKFSGEYQLIIINTIIPNSYAFKIIIFVLKK